VLKDVERGVTVIKGEPDYEELSVKVYGAGARRYTYQGKELVEHDGSNIGYKTAISRFINDNLGIVVLSNDEDFGSAIIETVKWRLADEILGLKKIDWHKRYQKKYEDALSKARSYTPRPKSAKPPSSEIKNMAQTFRHSTCGFVSPCHLQAKSPSPTCVSFLRSDTVKPIIESLDYSIPTLIAPYYRFFSSHLVFTHFDENLFNVSIFFSNADIRRERGLSEDGDVVFERDTALALWMDHSIDGRGWGMMGNWWGKGLEAKDPQGEGMEKAEVIFLKN